MIRMIRSSSNRPSILKDRSAPPQVATAAGAEPATFGVLGTPASGLAAIVARLSSNATQSADSGYRRQQPITFA
jgi:hypothetical protein